MKASLAASVLFPLSFSAAIVFAAGPADTHSQTVAPEGIAKLSEVQGTVLVSQGDAMTAGVNEQRLNAGTRIVTTASTSVTIVFDKDCQIKLTENERFVIRDASNCGALAATVESLAPAAGAIGGSAAVLATTGTSGIGAVALGGLAGTGVAVYEALRNSKVPLSPN
jgi:hypothetical protein